MMMPILVMEELTFLLMPIMLEISPALMLHIFEFNIQATETWEQCWHGTALSEVHYWKSMDSHEFLYLCGNDQ